MESKGFISKYGFFSTIVVTVIGVGIFSYPHKIAKEVGSDGWFVTIVAGTIAFLFIYILIKVSEMNGFKHFVYILDDNFGKILSKIICLIFVAYNISVMAIAMRIFAEVIKMYLLNRTPTEFILFVMILVGTYLIRGDIGSLIKFNELSFWVMFIPIFCILPFSIVNADFTNILPVFNNPPINYIDGIRHASFSFFGFEIVLLIVPFLKSKNKIAKTALLSILFITVFYLIIIVLCIAVFAKEETSQLLWPTITLIKTVSIPGAFIERWEGIVMAFWVLFYFTTFVNIYYFSSDILNKGFKLKDSKISCIIIIPLIYIVSLIPENISEVFLFSDSIVPYLHVFAVIIVPLVLLIIGKLKKREVKIYEND